MSGGGDWQPSAFSRVLLGLIGAGVFLGGLSFFGAAFSFIDAHRDWSPAIMVPALFLWSCGTAALIGIGTGLIAFALGREGSDHA